MVDEEQPTGTQDETSRTNKTETVPIKSDPSTSAKTSSIYDLTREADEIYEDLFVKTTEVKRAVEIRDAIFEKYQAYTKDNPEAENAPANSDMYNKVQMFQKKFSAAQEEIDSLKDQESRLKVHLSALNMYQGHKTSNNSDAGSLASNNRTRNNYSPVKPKMGGLIETYQGPEAGQEENPHRIG